MDLQAEWITNRNSLLAFPNFSSDFILETDASSTGLGAVLSQKQPDKKIKNTPYKNYVSSVGHTPLQSLPV